MTFGQVLIAATILVFAFVALAYNRFVRTRAHLRESWAGIDVELRRRYDLVGNLVETVRAYAAHERDVLERVTAARAAAAANTGAHETQIRDEQALVGALRELFAVVEGYPQLASDARFADLQAQLVETEDRLAAIRRLHNANVREWNTLGEVVPYNLLRSLVAWEPEPYFEVAGAVRESAPRPGF